MCNAKPGTRCGTDTYNSLAHSIKQMSDRLIKHPDIIDSLRFAGTIAEMEEKAIQFFAANSSIADPKKAIVEYRALIAKLPSTLKEKLMSEESLLRSANYLNGLQTRADSFAKNRDDNGERISQRDVAYAMSKTYQQSHADSIRKLKASNDIDKDSRIEAITKAYAMATKDTESILTKDIKDNSISWSSITSPEESTRIIRQRDGSFVIQNTFSVPEDHRDNMMVTAKSKFDIEKVIVSIRKESLPNGERLVETQYALQAKDLDTAKKAHRDIYLDSPARRLRA